MAKILLEIKEAHDLNARIVLGIDCIFIEVLMDYGTESDWEQHLEPFPATDAGYADAIRALADGLKTTAQSATFDIDALRSQQ